MIARFIPRIMGQIRRLSSYSGCLVADPERRAAWEEEFGSPDDMPMN